MLGWLVHLPAGLVAFSAALPAPKKLAIRVEVSAVVEDALSIDKKPPSWVMLKGESYVPANCL
jgi:hypothetical protein